MPEPEPQHLRALGRANEVRFARAALRRKIASGETSAAAVIRTAPWEAQTMTVYELLGAQRRWGPQRVEKLLAQVPISETKTVGALTGRQRDVLDGLLTPKTRRTR